MLIIQKLLPAFFALTAFMFLFEIFIGIERLWHVYSLRQFTDVRLIQWMDALVALPEYWLLGVGTGGYDYFYAAIKSPQLGALRYDHAHNDYLEFFVTTGVVGLFLFIGCIFFLFRGYFAFAKRQGSTEHNVDIYAAFWAVSTVLIHSIVDFNLQIPANFLLFLYAAMLLRALLDRHAARRA